MNKCILIPLIGIFLMLTFSSCGTRGTEDLDVVADKADVSSSKVGEGTESLDTAADIKELVNEYTSADEEKDEVIRLLELIDTGIDTFITV